MPQYNHAHFVRLAMLHDEIALSFDAISGNPAEQNLTEARAYLQSALRRVQLLTGDRA